MKIPHVDLKAQYQNIKLEIKEAIDRVIDSTIFIMGEEVSKFEKEFSQTCGAGYGVGTSSGTTAIHLALAACGIGQGHEVITVPNTFIATSEAISHSGARPVFVDVEPDIYNLDPERLIEAITPRTKGIIAVHLYGHPADMDSINAIAKEHNLVVIEDCAQAHIAEYKGRKVGTLGEVGCFSFFPGKNLGAYGDAGMVITNNSEIAEKVRLLSNHGRKDKYHHLIEGYNYRLDALQAAILRVKLKHLEKWTDDRRKVAALYNSFLAETKVILPVEKEWAKHVYHLYVIRSHNRDRLVEILKREDISAGIHYPVALHQQEAYARLNYRKGDFPVAETCAQTVVSLPIFPELTEEGVRKVTEVIKNNENEQ